MDKESNNFHDDRFSQADRLEIYKKVMSDPISTLAAPEQYARVPLEGMPDPIGEVYREEKDEFLTQRRAFVNDDYKTHSQFTENYMVQEGLDFSIGDEGYAISEAYEAAKRFEEKYNDEKILKK